MIPSRSLAGTTGVVALIVGAVALPALADGDHPTTMDAPASHAAPSGMTVTATVKRDMMKGHNLFVTTKGFTFAPQHASSKHVQGEGHAHIYVDGKKLTRLYGNAFYLGDLASGTRKVKVTLNGNDHGDYVRGGKAVASTVTVKVP